MRRTGALLSTLAVAVSIAAAGAPGAGSHEAAARVSVRLREFKVVPSPAHAPAGRITFTVRNVGTIPHEFVVLRTNIAPAKLPKVGARAKEIGRVGKIRAFGRGQTRRLSLTLKPGKYVLLCNLPGHYAAGQFAGFRVP
jgi:uncharacterized cupredoxin-like copper-binding protein